jgi:hypothetical protein
MITHTLRSGLGSVGIRFYAFVNEVQRAHCHEKLVP